MGDSWELLHRYVLFMKYLTVKTKPRFRECYTFFGCETKKEVVHILVVFQDEPMFSHII